MICVSLFLHVTCMDMDGLSVMGLASTLDFLSQYYMQYTAMQIKVITVKITSFALIFLLFANRRVY